MICVKQSVRWLAPSKLWKASQRCYSYEQSLQGRCGGDCPCGVPRPRIRASLSLARARVRLSTRQGSPAIDAQGAPGTGIPTLGSRFPHTIKKHFVLNKTRRSIYIPQLGRTLLILPA